jgi:hypothetical protein
VSGGEHVASPLSVFALRDEEARPVRRRERRRHEQLREVLDAEARSRSRDAVIEDELAFAVELHVAGRGAAELAALEHGQVVGHPALLLGDAAGLFHGGEPGWPERRVVLPALEVGPEWLDLGERSEDAQLDCRFLLHLTLAHG